MSEWLLLIAGTIGAAIGAVLGPVVIKVISTRISDLWKARRQILVREKSSNIIAQSSETFPENLNLFYNGENVAAFHDNVFSITNQAFEPVDQIDLSLVFNPANVILDYKLIDPLSHRTSTVLKSGNEIKISTPFLNSRKALDDELVLHVYSKQEIKNVTLTGGGSGWRAKYKGDKKNVKGEISHKFGAYVCVEGPIGVGKSTLAELLQQAWLSKILFEEAEKNPYLDEFYQDRGKYAFQTQLFFLFHRYSQLSNIEIGNSPLVTDFMFDRDTIFANLNLFGDELDTYMMAYNLLCKTLPKPDLIIYLFADVDTLMNRIKNRGEKYKHIKRNYIIELLRLYNEFFQNYSDAPVYKLDTTNLNIVDNLEDKKIVHELIENALIENRKMIKSG